MRRRSASLCSFFLFVLRSGLTHKQLLQLRDIVKEHGVGKQGRSRSSVSVARYLLHVFQHQKVSTSCNEAANRVAAAEFASPTTIRVSFQTFSRIETVIPPDTLHRGGGNPLHPSLLIRMSPDHEKFRGRLRQADGQRAQMDHSIHAERQGGSPRHI